MKMRSVLLGATMLTTLSGGAVYADVLGSGAGNLQGALSSPAGNFGGGIGAAGHAMGGGDATSPIGLDGVGAVTQGVPELRERARDTTRDAVQEARATATPAQDSASAMIEAARALDVAADGSFSQTAAASPSATAGNQTLALGANASAETSASASTSDAGTDTGSTTATPEVTKADHR